MAMVNSSGWPVTRRLTVANKAEFLHWFIKDELVGKCQAMLDALGQGLELLGFLSLLRSRNANFCV